jgi:putative CocE/NonD family hydrolase
MGAVLKGMTMKARSVRLLLALSVLAGLVVGLPSTASAAKKPDGGRPFNYVKQLSKLSKPKFKTVEESARIELKDGETMYVEITRPKTSKDVPTVLELSPYHGTIADREGFRIFPGPRDKDGSLIGLTGYFPPRGYAVVMADLRGTGKSSGCLDHMGQLDQQDSKDLLTWISKQKWSNGRVGMIGHSYVGSTPSMAMAQGHPALKTIVPSAGLAAIYHHEFQDGVPYFLQWAGPLFAYEMLAMNRYLPAELSPLWSQVPNLGSQTGDHEDGDPTQFGCGWANSAAVTGEAYTSGAEVDWHRDRDWRKAATKSNIPVFMVHGVNDNAARIAAIDWFNARHNSKDKAWIGQWDHGGGSPHRPNNRTCGDDVEGQCTNDQYTAAVHAWFDKWLMKRKVDTGPKAEIFLNEGKVMTSPTWPPRTSRVKFFPGAEGKLGSENGEAGTAGYVADSRGQVQELQTGGVNFTTDPVTQDTAIVGVPTMKLAASVIGSPRVHINATLYDAEGDNLTRIGRAGWAVNPELRDGWANPQPVIPAEKMTMKLTAQSQAYVLRKGHSLVLRFASSHPDKVATFGSGAQVTIHFGGDDGTSINLPIVRGPKLYSDLFGESGRHQ